MNRKVEAKSSKYKILGKNLLKMHKSQVNKRISKSYTSKNPLLVNMFSSLLVSLITVLFWRAQKSFVICVYVLSSLCINLLKHIWIRLSYMTYPLHFMHALVILTVYEHWYFQELYCSRLAYWPCGSKQR